MIESEAQALVKEYADSKKPLRVGLLSNPGSGRNRRGLKSVYRILSRYPETLHREAQTPDQVAEVLQEFASRSVDLIAFNSGDGTVQAALSVLFNQRPFPRLPMLALLRGGSTNVNIRDIGIPGNRDRALSRLLAWAGKVHTGIELRQRPVLRVSYSSDAAPIYGMLFGAGAITRGIEYYHHRIHHRGVYDGLAIGLTSLRILLAFARRDPDYVAPISANVEFSPCEPEGQPTAGEKKYLMLLVSSLERLFLGIHPYWGLGPGALHYTALQYPPAHLLRALPSLLRGRPNRLGTPENGYESHKIDELHLIMDGNFTLDGELYRADPDNGPVSIAQEGPITFVRL